MLVRFRERVLLLAGRFALMLRFPFLVGHPVDALACFRPAQRDAAGLRLLLVPVRKTVAAETGEIHEIDVLDIASLAQMLEEPAERCGFELGLGLRIAGHEEASLSSIIGW